MRAPIILFILSVTVMAVSFAAPEGLALAALLLGGIMVLASLILLVQAWFRREKPAAPTERIVLVDGSNVLHWKDETPQIEPVRAVVVALKAKGFRPGVVFDANAGYKIGNRYLNERALARLVGLPTQDVLVAPKGSPADPFLLDAAQKFGARIVTNDRFRDWVAMHPEVRQPGYLVRGGWRDGAVWLEDVR